jgi:ribosomal protein S18 acetylase RimI-like enzyme
MIKIRSATAQDQPIIDHMTELACKHQSMAHIPVPSGCQILVAEQQDAVCGMVAINQLSDSLTQIAYLWVDIGRRSNGIGKPLLDSVPGKEIVLLMRRNDAALYRFYQRNGFVDGELINLRKVRDVVKTI